MSAQVAIITGSTSGIGLGIAEAFAAKGYQLVMHGLGDAAELQAIVNRVATQYKIKAVLSQANMMDPKACEALIRQGEKEFGRVDVLVNNAGIQHVASVENFPAEKWDAVIAVNLNAVFHTTKAALPGMRARGFGRIINIASAHGKVASINKSAYCASKFGVIGLTKVTALELAGTGVTCNAICPGFAKTPLVMKQVEDLAKSRGVSVQQSEHDFLSEKQPSGKFVDPKEIGALAVYMASPEAGAMTGSDVSIDGGWTAR